MAGPIKISVLADVGQAVKSVTHFSDVVDEETKRVVTSLGDSKLTGGWGKLQEGFDVADTRAMGFRDTITGVQDTMTGFQGLLGDRKPGQTFADSLLQVGMGVGDLASGFANFIVPMMAVASSTKAGAAAQWLLNAAMSANPIGIVVLAIVALVAVLVIAYKNSETFRNIVNGAFRSVTGAVMGAFNWIRGHWPLLLAILTGPVGIAVLLITRNFDRIVSFVKSVPGRILAIFGRLKGGLSDIGRDMVSGFVSGIEGAWHWVTDKIAWLTNLIPSGVRSLLGINSPSKVFKEIGGHIGSGLALGIEGSADGVTSATKSLVNIPGSLSGIGSGSSSGSGVVLEVKTSGSPMDELFAQMMKKYVRVNGGNVQKALGTA